MTRIGWIDFRIRSLGRKGTVSFDLTKSVDY